MVERMLDGVEVRLDCDYFDKKDEYDSMAEKIVFTGMIDEYYNYCYGELEYRSLRFETDILDTDNYQGNAVVNYTEYEVPYTRIIEHKHFEYIDSEKTVITREYPADWKRGEEPYYPMNDEKNNALYAKYRELADKEDKVIFGGRLGMYKYYDMHNVIEEALNITESLLS
ncbi:MAG: UDP-galactopyranose mutase, partial [Lachnospiraceae bacterium]|nr:UDP-galactopyranose mutase [Lachnospiraceae bacterium]